MESLIQCLKSLLTKVKKITPASFLTFSLFSVFGVGSWLALNGIWGELPVLVASLPECYNLPAVLTVVIQLANVGPILYAAIKFSLGRFSVRQLSIEIGAVYTLVFVGILACVALSIAWDRTAIIAGHEHSVALIALIFFLALVDCTSSLVFIPFMKHFPAYYITALYIGEGLSGVLPSVAALSQGFVNESINCAKHYVGVEELGVHFSPNIFFAFLGGLTLLSGIAFTGIITLPIVRRQMITNTPRVFIGYGQVHSPTSSSSSRFGNESRFSSEEVTESREERGNLARNGDGSPLMDSSGESSGESSAFIPTEWNSNTPCCEAAREYVTKLCSVARDSLQPLVCMFVVNFFSNGALPAISAFLFKPYGNTVYTVAVNLGIIAAPLSALSYLILSHSSRALIAILTSIVALLAIYLLIMASLSPHPLLSDHIAGKVLIVSIYKPKESIIIKHTSHGGKWFK